MIQQEKVNLNFINKDKRASGSVPNLVEIHFLAIKF